MILEQGLAPGWYARLLCGLALVVGKGLGASELGQDESSPVRYLIHICCVCNMMLGTGGHREEARMTLSLPS